MPQYLHLENMDLFRYSRRKNVGDILDWAHQNDDLFTISLCHEPGSFLTTTLNDQKLILENKMAVFPDSVDFFARTIAEGFKRKAKELNH